MKLRIILATDDRFAMGCGVTMQSILQTTRSRVRFALFQSGVSDENLARLHEIVAAHPGTDLELIDADKVLSPLPPPARSDWYSRMIYARLVAPDLLDDRRALYLDTDTLVKEDVAALLEWDLAGYPLAAVPDYGAQCRAIRDVSMRAHLEYATGERPITRYFNSGVLVMDLEAFRQRRLGERAMEFIQDNPALHFPDQDALNMAVGDHVAFLPERWNTMVMAREVCFDPFAPPAIRHRVRAAFNNPAIIHYTGYKPWSPYPVYWRNEFLRVLRETPWKQVQISTRGLDWRQKRKIAKAWRAQFVRLRVRRREVLLQLFGRPLVHWSRPPERLAA